ncbi:hypothetical protein ACJJTC_007551 [Scirpophaga incertulas]
MSVQSLPTLLYFAAILLPMYTESFDLLIIPMEKPIIRTKNIIQLTVPELADRYFENADVPLRLDIEQYDDPTEMPDIDNYDYNNDRSYRDDLNLNNHGDDKIVGGFEVDINLYPYHVAYGTNCGGAIIDKKWVVTAGHCGKKPYVRVGSKYLNRGRKVLVKEHYIHPMWTSDDKKHPFDYDFQLLKLEESLKLDENIQAIKLAHIEDMTIGKVVTVTGWGNTDENGPYSSVLRAVRVPIISKDKCQNVPFPYFRGELTARMFCAGFSEGKKDACQGDSGGPAVSFDRLLGLVSFGYGCATPGSYGVYSKIAKVRPWIESTTGLRFD